LRILFFVLVSFLMAGCSDERILVCTDSSRQAIYKLEYRFGKLVDYSYRSDGKWVEDCSPRYTTITDDSLTCRSSGGFTPAVIDLVTMTSKGGLFEKNMKCRWQ